MSELEKCRLCEHKPAPYKDAPKLFSCSNAGCFLYRATLDEQSWNKLMARPEPAINPVLLETCHTLIETTKESDLQIYPRTYLAHIKGLAKVIIGLKGEPK
jgi:hypothetical protein